MARDIVNRQVNIYIQSGEAQKAYDQLIKKQNEWKAALEKTTDPKQIKYLNDQLDKLKEPIDRASKKLKGELAPSFKDVEAAARKMLNEFKRTGDPEVLKKYQTFNAELQRMKAEINGVQDAQKSFGKTGFFSASFWGNLAANGVAKLSSAISGMFQGAVEEALNADESTRRLESTLSNLGRSDAFDRLKNKADEMAQRFRYLDNDDIVAVFNKLIDYGNLTEKEMNDLLPVIIDFAAKSKVSLDESADVIIKALSGNGKALKQYGIDIKDAGSETERLNLIMTTLKDKVDGAGEAFQNSAKGGIAVAKQKFADLKEEIGNSLIPVLNGLLSVVASVLDSIVDLFRTAAEKRDRFIRQARTANLGENSVVRSLQKDMFDIEKDLLERELKYGPSKGYTKEQIYKIHRDRVEKTIAELKTDKPGTVRGLNIITGKVLGLEDFLSFLNGQMSSNTKLGIPSTDKPNLAKQMDKVKKSAEEMLTPLERMLRLRKDVEAFLHKGDVSELEKRIQQETDFVKRMNGDEVYRGIDPQKATALRNRDRLAANELAVLTARGKQKLEAQKKLLDEQMRMELSAANLTQNEIALIEEKYRKQKEDLEKQRIIAIIEAVQEYANMALTIFTAFSNAKTAMENAELERDRSINEAKTRELDKRLRKGLISQKQYDIEVEKINRQQAAKEKAIRKQQWEREKKIAIAQIVIDQASAIAKTIAKHGFPLGLIFVAPLIALMAAQIKAITSQKPPQFAKGGKLGGDYHSQGGNAITDRHGNKIAEIERGEGIINRHSMASGNRYTVSGTPSQIASAINSIYGGVSWEPGASLIPAWASRKPTPFNLPAIKKYFAAGGVYNNGSSSAAGNADTSLNEALKGIAEINAALVQVLQRGISANVLLSDINNQQTRLTDIQKDSTMV